MTAATATTARDSRVRRGGRRAGVAAALAAALVGGACAQEADGPDAATGAELGEFAATSDYLASVAEATDGLTYRMSMDMTMAVEFDGDGFDMGGTLMTGEVDGELSAMTMDLGELFRDMADQAPPGDELSDGFLDADLTMEMVTDGSTMYMRAPYFTAMGEMALDSGATRDDLGPLADLAALGDEWGSIDLSEVSPSQVASAAGAQTADPRAFLDIIAEGTDVREPGTESIDGVDARGLGAVVTYGDMIAAQGMDADDVREQITAGAGPGEDDELAGVFDDVMDAMFAMEMPVEVWVDDDDRVRRISLDMNMTEILGAVADETGEDMGGGGMSLGMVMDFTDYGDESIEIEVPADAVDITDEYLALIEGGGLGTGAGGPALGST